MFFRDWIFFFLNCADILSSVKCRFIETEEVDRGGCRDKYQETEKVVGVLYD